MFAASDTAMHSRNATHTATRIRRVRWPGLSNPTVASNSNPSTESGHSIALVASARR